MIRPADNPYRTARIDNLPYRLNGDSWTGVIDRLFLMGRRAAVVGPHGCGKTRFLAGLADELQALGHAVTRVRCARDPLPSRTTSAGAFILADEADSLGLPGRLRLSHLSRTAAGLIITTHRTSRRLPVLHRCSAPPQLVRELIITLTGAAAPSDLHALLDSHEGNVREVFRELYRRHANA